ncbi:FAD-dependent oxidoreductase [Pseudomonas sp. HR96]|uniref:NAD(P)/FAD-dependent oxidoreductase n=1 Tax=Pseudomonas sp. HR96 TaxID=1027966 RepID=UPI002A763B15|nr:FAD-dependent oxidoreductase [Pseudomonas sp. HR96]WPP02021.1 FAD-dependent oxidoreductase [Pseudomonas sp. HR96]
MPVATHCDIAVVGAGVIGVACALQLARQGLQVTVIDPQPPGRGASFGNAGHLATEQVFPIADASILRRLPAMLLDPLGPLRLDWRYLPQAAPWFLRLLRNLREAPMQRTVAGLRALNDNSLSAWQQLLQSIGQADLFKLDGSLLVFEHAESARAIAAVQGRMGEQQVPVELWPAAVVRDAAPQLHSRIKGGLFFAKTGHFIDPYQVVQAMAAAAGALGVQFMQRRVEGAQVTADGVSLMTADGPFTTRQVLVACGAHSAPLVRQLTGKAVPLETERGYHLMLPQETGRLPFAVTSLERRFIMTPMSGGLRLAGTVEFAGLQRPANMQRAWQLHRLSQGLFERDLSCEGASPWMGFRPSLPDSLPVIDRLCDGKVLLAFGHQHLGLTQAAVTAQMVGRLATPTAGWQGVPAVEPYRLGRFFQGTP